MYDDDDDGDDGLVGRQERALLGLWCRLQGFDGLFFGHVVPHLVLLVYDHPFFPTEWYPLYQQDITYPLMTSIIVCSLG